MSVPGLRRLERSLAIWSTLLESRSYPAAWTCPSCRKRKSTALRPRQQPQLHTSRAYTSQANKSREHNEAGVEHSSRPAYPSVTATSSRSARETISPHRQTSTSYDKIQDDFGIIAALLKKDRDRLLLAIDEAASRDIDYFRQLPYLTWVECLKLLTSNPAGSSLHDIHQAFNSRRVQRLAGSAIVPPKMQRARLDRVLNIVAKIQYRAQIQDSILTFRILLENLASWGHLRAAEKVWTRLKSRGIRPDVFCYNAYMQAHLFNEESRLRQRAQSKSTTPKVFDKNTDITLFNHVSSQTVLELIEEMQANNVKADTTTLCRLIEALGRQGELAQICVILQSTWGIDLGRSKEIGDASSLPIDAKRHKPTSTLYPTSLLQSSIVQAFGLNNRMPEALWAVEYISHQYGIPIRENVWSSILKWSWLQARVKSKGRLKPNEPQLQLHTASQLFGAMISPAYSIKPNMQMLDIIFQANKGLNGTRFGTTRPWKLAEVMAIGLSEYQRSKSRLRKLLGRHTTPAMHETDAARLQVNTSWRLLRKWAKSILEAPVAFPKKTDESGSQELQDWQFRGLPNFLLQYEDFSPSRFKYELQGAGRVELNLDSNIHIAERDLASAFKLHSSTFAHTDA